MIHFKHFPSFATCLAAVFAGNALAAEPPVEQFNFVAGTQAIGGNYQFTGEPAIVEAARIKLEMGSNIMKFSLEGKSGFKTLALRAAGDPAVLEVFRLPFAYYFMWVSPLSAPWGDGTPFNPVRLESQKREIYDLTCHLLKTYDGSGKTFFLGNWEGDWLLTGVNPKKVPDNATVRNMIEWAKARQKAVDDARRDTPHKNVAVYHYIEVNRVRDAKDGKIRVTNKVLPEANPDYVSYSAYDAQGPNLERTMPELLDYVQSHLKPKPGFPAKRVFIGEYGLPAKPKDSGGSAAQALLVRRVLRAALEWDCPFVLYWQLYDNENKGFWLINDKNERQPAYHVHHEFLAAARTFVADFRSSHGRAPYQAEYRKAMLGKVAGTPDADPDGDGLTNAQEAALPTPTDPLRADLTSK